MAFTIRGTGVLALLSLILTIGAHAHRAPAENPAPPGPYAFEIERASDPLDPVADGWVNRTSGAYATLLNQHAGPYAGDPETAARAYLADRAGLFGLSHGGEDLLLDKVQESPAGRHVRFVQAVGTVPVWRADLVVSLAPTTGGVRSTHSNYDPILAHAALGTVAAIDAATARRVAIDALGITGEPRWLGDPSATLWIVRQEDRVGSPARLAWRVAVPVEVPMGDWEVFVDAIDSGILRLSDRMVYTDGSGYVFDPDPLTTAEVAYGGNYADNSDGDTAELNAERFLRTLHDLTFEGGVYNLRGPFAELLDFESPSGAPVTEVDPNAFTYTRSQQGFEDVMCYYHLDANQRYIQSLGFSDIQNGPIQCDPHGLNGQDNSHYIPSSNRIAFGEGGVDDDEDTDVILHEYGHAIQHDIVSNWGGGHQGAMGEGFGDYWAGSYSADISLYRWYWVFNWDGHNPFWGGRVLNTTKHYPENLIGQVHSDGEIWSAPWMQIWFECGRTVTDTDILLHHYYQGGSATMAQAAAFAMQADQDLYDALHSGSMDYYFTARGFFTASQFDVPELTHTPLGDQTTGGPYPLTVTIASTSAIVAGSVRVKFGTGQAFDQEAVLSPTGNPNEWGGSIPGQGGNVDIRYYLVADNTAGWRGAHPRGAEFLYHQFHVGPLTAAEDLAGAQGLALLPASPNPFNPRTNLTFTLPHGGDVRFVIHDVSGRAVRTLAEGRLDAGIHDYSWDGRNDAGQPVPAGLYFARLEADGRSLSRKIVMAK